MIVSNVQCSVEKTEAKPAGVENLEAALKERLEVCRKIKATAESEGNSSKARRYGRICKQFEDAVKLYSRGKSVPLDELPTPPGFDPLVASTQSSTPPAATETTEKPVPQTSPESVSPENKSPVSPKNSITPPGRQAGM